MGKQDHGRRSLRGNATRRRLGLHARYRCRPPNVPTRVALVVGANAIFPSYLRLRRDPKVLASIGRARQLGRARDLLLNDDGIKLKKKFTRFLSLLLTHTHTLHQHITPGIYFSRYLSDFLQTSLGFSRIKAIPPILNP